MATTFPDLLSATKQAITEQTPDQVQRRLGDESNLLLIDVREPNEYQDGAIPDATHVPRGFLELRIEDIERDRSRPIVLYCAGGTRSALAAKALQDMGYGNVVSMSGGFREWKDSGKPVLTPEVLSPHQQSRYSRHLLIPEVGEAGQLKLLKSKVLFIGAGGLGSPAALYLAAAGVGTIGIVDNDVVDESNLQRQILHTTDRVGLPKTDSAAQTLLALNPTIDVETHQVRLDSSNIEDVLRPYDLVIDGTDNFPTRYLINDACVFLDKPNVHGSIFRFEGQVTAFIPHDGPCYRCLYPQPPPPELAPSCQEAGVLGVLPGVIGVLQAIEAIKILLGIGESLKGRLLMYDALRTQFRTMKLQRDPKCPICGDKPTITEYIDYEGFCSFDPSAAVAAH